MLRFERVGRFGTTTVKTGSVSFSLLFVIQDESVTVMARDFRLYRIGLFKGDAKQYIYTKKRNCRVRARFSSRW
jgi:hypothetical protein